MCDKKLKILRFLSNKSHIAEVMLKDGFGANNKVSMESLEVCFSSPYARPKKKKKRKNFHEIDYIILFHSKNYINNDRKFIIGYKKRKKKSLIHSFKYIKKYNIEILSENCFFFFVGYILRFT